MVNLYNNILNYKKFEIKNYYKKYNHTLIKKMIKYCDNKLENENENFVLFTLTNFYSEKDKKLK